MPVNLITGLPVHQGVRPDRAQQPAQPRDRIGQCAASGRIQRRVWRWAAGAIQVSNGTRERRAGIRPSVNGFAMAQRARNGSLLHDPRRRIGNGTSCGASAERCAAAPSFRCQHVACAAWRAARRPSLHPVSITSGEVAQRGHAEPVHHHLVAWEGRVLVRHHSQPARAVCRRAGRLAGRRDRWRHRLVALAERLADAGGAGGPAAARPGTTSPRQRVRAQVERYSFGSSITVFGRNGCSRSIGTGKMVVLLLVPAISVSVCR